MIGNAFEHVAQVPKRLDAIELCRSDERVDHGGAVAAAVGSEVEIVLPPDCHGSERALRNVVMRLDASVLNEVPDLNIRGGSRQD